MQSEAWGSENNITGHNRWLQLLILALTSTSDKIEELWPVTVKINGKDKEC